MLSVSWFEIPVNDMERAKKFYESLFGVEINVVDFGGLLMGWLPAKEGGSSGALVKQESYIPSYEGTMIYFGVEEVNDVLDRVVPAGGKIVNPKQSIGEYGYVGHFEDSEGNRVALHQNA